MSDREVYRAHIFDFGDEAAEPVTVTATERVTESGTAHTIDIGIGTFDDTDLVDLDAVEDMAHVPVADYSQFRHTLIMFLDEAARAAGWDDQI